MGLRTLLAPADPWSLSMACVTDQHAGVVSGASDDYLRTDALTISRGAPDARAATNAGLDPHVPTHLLVANRLNQAVLAHRTAWEAEPTSPSESRASDAISNRS